MGKRRMMFRVWYRLTDDGIAYRIVPDVLQYTPDDAWSACKTYGRVADALAYIGRTYCRVPLNIEIVPDLREHEADSIARVQQVEVPSLDHPTIVRKKVSKKKVTKKVTRKATGLGPFTHDPGPRMPHGDPLMPPPLLP